MSLDLTINIDESYRLRFIWLDDRESARVYIQENLDKPDDAILGRGYWDIAVLSLDFPDARLARKGLLRLANDKAVPGYSMAGGTIRRRTSINSPIDGAFVAAYDVEIGEAAMTQLKQTINDNLVVEEPPFPELQDKDVVLIRVGSTRLKYIHIGGSFYSPDLFGESSPIQQEDIHGVARNGVVIWRKDAPVEPTEE